jgi:hypothetical protein
MTYDPQQGTQQVQPRPPPPAPMQAPPPGYYYGPPQAQKQSTNGFAIASLVLGIVWIYCIGSILALVFGYKARKQIDESNGREGGRGLATAGIVLGWIGVGLAGLAIAVIVMVKVFGGSATEPVTGALNDPTAQSSLLDDRAAQTSLRNALTAAKTAYTDNSDYSKSTDTDLPVVEPSLTYEPATAVSTGPTDVSVATANLTGTDQQIWAAAALSNSGRCYLIKDQAVGIGADTFYGQTANPSACDGTYALNISGQSG